MSDVEFCDTNVLLYAHDSTAPPEKRERAQSLLTALWASRRGCLSTQVLQEFYVNVVRVTHDAVRARDIVQQYLQWSIVIVESPSIGSMDGGFERRTADGRRRHAESVYADGVKWSE